MTTTRHGAAQHPSRETAVGHGYLSEMFCSIQGEGPFVGERQVFVRTAGCTATCRWCDTVYSKIHAPRFVIHEGENGEKHTLDNPVPIDRAVAEVGEFAARQRSVDAVSITGGEPLEQPEFVTALAARLHAGGLRLYLETNGVHAGPLRAILPYVDVVAMDIKLPSAVGVEMWDDHRRFLSVIEGSDFDPARGVADKTVFVKIVVDAAARLDEIQTAVDIVAAVSRAIPLVLQPESGALLSANAPPEGARRLLRTIENARGAAASSLESVRVIPQVHRILKVR